MTLENHWSRKTAARAIRSRRWDFVVLQDGSRVPFFGTQEILESVQRFDRVIKSVGSKTVLYMTWADRFEQGRQIEITNAYQEAAKQTGALLVPVGRVWQKALGQKPDLPLFEPDNHHAAPLGAYLTAMTFVSQPTGTPAVRLPHYNSLLRFIGGLVLGNFKTESETTKFLQGSVDAVLRQH